MKLSERMRSWLYDHTSLSKEWIPDVEALEDEVERLNHEIESHKLITKGVIDDREQIVKHLREINQEGKNWQRRAEAAEAENQRLKEQLNNDKIPECLGEYNNYLDCKCICFYGDICSRYTETKEHLTRVKALPEK